MFNCLKIYVWCGISLTLSYTTYVLCRIVTLITLYVNKILDNVLLYVTLEYMAQIDRNIKYFY